MKKTIAMMMLLAGGMLAAPRVNVGIGFGFGAPAPVAQVAVTRPACPGPGYAWVDGYYAANRVWVNGYWAPPARVVVAPRYDRDHFDRDRYDRNRFDHARFDRDHDGYYDRRR